MTDVKLLVPKGSDVTDLTMGELDTASRRLACDVLEALVGEKVQGRRYAAMLELAVIWARRSGDMKAKREKFEDFTFDELARALGMRGDETELPPADPTNSADEPSESP